MPRPRHGLGQGLDALVSSRQRSGGSWSDSGILGGSSTQPSNSTPDLLQWEYACLVVERRKRRRKRRLGLILSNPDPTVTPRNQRFRGLTPWTALGLLGADGWELVSARKRVYVLKRVVPPTL
jgi:hypothetical protein